MSTNQFIFIFIPGSRLQPPRLPPPLLAAALILGFWKVKDHRAWSVSNPKAQCTTWAFARMIYSEKTEKKDSALCQISKAMLCAPGTTSICQFSEGTYSSLNLLLRLAQLHHAEAFLHQATCHLEQQSQSLLSFVIFCLYSYWEVLSLQIKMNLGFLTQIQEVIVSFTVTHNISILSNPEQMDKCQCSTSSAKKSWLCLASRAMSRN